MTSVKRPEIEGSRSQQRAFTDHPPLFDCTETQQNQYFGSFCTPEERSDRTLIWGLTKKGGFPKGWFWRMFPRNENWNEGTFGSSPPIGCSPGTKTGTRARSHVPPERKPERGHIRQNHLFGKPPFWLFPFEIVGKRHPRRPNLVYLLLPRVFRIPSQ